MRAKRLSFAFVHNHPPPGRAPTTMASSSKPSGPNKDKKRAAPEPLAGGSTGTTSSGSSKFDTVSKAILAPFTSRKHDSAKILTDCACSLCYVYSS